MNKLTCIAIALFFLMPVVHAVETDDVEFEMIHEAKVKKARAGNVDAQLEIARIFEQGKGTRQNYSSALKWYKMAAQQGNRDAQFKVGYFYYKGLGADVNPEKAYEFLITPAMKGDAKAQFYVGEMHEKGFGVSKHLPTALKWYKKAKLGEYSEAVAAVARMEKRIK